MVRARIQRGRVKLQDPVPPAWDGQTVKLVLLGPEDPFFDVSAELAALHAMGPMEWEAGERRQSRNALGSMDSLSKKAMQKRVSRRP